MARPRTKPDPGPQRGPASPDAAARSWDALAPGYDEIVTPSNLPLAMHALRLAGLRPGTTLLDVAAGSGAVSLAAARLGARVTAVDISPLMIERLERRARAAGLELAARVMDGHALDLESDRFDMVASQFGVMLFPDLPRGLREMARVTRPGGQVVVVAFGSPAKVEFLRFFTRAVQAVVPGFAGLPQDPPPLPFQVQDPEKLRREMAAAGLEQVQVEQTSEEKEYASGDQFWTWMMNSNPIPRMVLASLALTPGQLDVARQAAEDLIRERAGGSGAAVLTNAINVGIGRRPG
ncbi:MAG TPA: methyltransferase domain-containing protein [Woeseiaceae bacterium]|nr:methyltransferase domain-containing protein [Woeseiaceae bacterium]